MKMSMTEFFSSSPLAETDRLLLFLLGVTLILIFVSMFYHPEENKRPHKAAVKVFRVLKRRRVKSKYTKKSDKQHVLSSLDRHLSTHMARCPYCGTGKPGWQKHEILDLTDTRRTLVVSVTAQTCQKCGHVQIFDADWLQKRGDA
jgi:predicted Zn-ribbon and HTH transcriptional regulator